ncbi:MAG: hypoxanthine phosphoribosyltransferase [candidate division NC10 bacterium]|nr:hypoxanthine phosphoribosyltransferase [candidate division NC10 bacterium]
MEYRPGKALLTAEEIAKRVQELAGVISREYQGRDLLLVCILKGAAVFWADLSRQISIPHESDFVALSSYGNATESSREIKFEYDLSTNITGRDVLIIEDIVDTGHTIKCLKEALEARGPKSLKICALLDKAERREAKVTLDYIGFIIPNEFVVGYGLDFAQKYRHLPYIAVLVSP